MCLYPKLIRNTKYTKTKKNGGIIPAFFDNRVLAVPIGCGKCMECLKKEGRKWQQRLLEDIKTNKNGKCVTLTFSDESIRDIKRELRYKWVETIPGTKVKVRQFLKGYELDNEIATYAVKHFRERWRKEFKTSIRHWLVTELGHNGTENVHMHGIVYTNEETEKIRKHWKYGYIKVDEKRGFVNGKTVNYITKYISKIDFDHKEYKPKVLTSPGIGNNYTETYSAELNKYQERVGQTREYYKTPTGHKTGLNIYWRNKIYTEEQREKLWIEKLDKQVRYIGKQEIDISTKEGEEYYYKVLAEERKKSIRLGYGNGERDWNRKKYEEERRMILISKRIERANAK